MFRRCGDASWTVRIQSWRIENESQSYLVSLKLVPVIFGFLQGPITSVAQLAKDIEENIGICCGSALITRVYKHMVHIY